MKKPQVISLNIEYCDVNGSEGVNFYMSGDVQKITARGNKKLNITEIIALRLYDLCVDNLTKGSDTKIIESEGLH